MIVAYPKNKIDLTRVKRNLTILSQIIKIIKYHQIKVKSNSNLNLTNKKSMSKHLLIRKKQIFKNRVIKNKVVSIV